MHVGLVGFFGADIQEALLDQLAYLRVLVAAKNRGNLARKDGGEWLTVEVDIKQGPTEAP